MNGLLTGTISHFTIGGIRNGGPVWSPLTYAETPISDVNLSDSCLGFVWSGDPPFHGGDVKFVAEGTDVAYINIPMSEEEMKGIYADHWGLAGLSPTIPLHREGETENENLQQDSADDWKVTFTAKLVNEAEFQYRADHGVYADYMTLLHSGQLERTRGINWTIVPINLKSEIDPLPGHVIRVVVSPDGGSYRLSIMERTSAECPSGFFSDETGVIVKRQVGECSAK